MSQSILVVEEDRVLSGELARALRREGFDVLVARDGHEALIDLQRAPPDAVVCRLLLAGRSGFEVAAAARDAGLPVLALTASFKGPRNREDAMERLGLLDLLEKPVDAVQVATTLAGALGSPARRTPTRPPPGERTELPADIPASGDLDRVFLGRLLYSVHLHGATGVLRLRHGRRRSDVFLERGEPVHVRSNAIAGCLGRVLVREGRLSDAQCRRSVRLAKERGTRQGEVLVELGAAASEDIAFGLDRQLRFRLLALFDWQEGRYRFVSSPEEPPARAALPVPLATIVAEGVANHSPWERVRAELAPLEDGCPVWGADPRLREVALARGPDEEALFAELDGRRTLGRILEDSGLGRETGSRLLLALLCTRKAELHAGPAVRRTELTPGREGRR